MVIPQLAKQIAFGISVMVAGELVMAEICDFRWFDDDEDEDDEVFVFAHKPVSRTVRARKPVARRAAPAPKTVRKTTHKKKKKGG